MGFCFLFYTPEAFSQDEPGSPPKKSGLAEDMEKGIAQANQRYGQQLSLIHI